MLSHDLLEHIEDRDCTITQDEIDQNMDVFNQGIDPALPMALYTKKQADCQEFSIDARVPISQELMVMTVTKHAVNCGDFQQAWREWRQMPAADQTWANWKTHWTHALQENRNNQKLPVAEGDLQEMIWRETWPTNSSLVWTIWRMRQSRKTKQ